MDTKSASTADSPSDGKWARISLTQGLFARVSLEDYFHLSKWKWTASFESRGQKFYAVRWSRVEEQRPGEKRFKVRMHRWVMKQGHRPGPGEPVVDHINGDSLDNRRENLRLCTYQENAMNRIYSRKRKIEPEL